MRPNNCSVQYSVHLFFVLCPVVILAQKVIENLSCDFNKDTLCNWTYENGEARFEPIFNSTNFDYNFVDGMFH